MPSYLNTFTGHPPTMDGHQYTAEFEAPGGKPVLKAYPDPKSGRAPWTIGLGHTGDDVKEGDEWTYDQCMATFYADYASAEVAAARTVGSGTWYSLSDPRKAVLTDLAFQMGASGLSKFFRMLVAIHAGNWDEAATEMKASQYHKDTPSRCEKNAETLLTGEWP